MSSERVGEMATNKAIVRRVAEFSRTEFSAAAPLSERRAMIERIICGQRRGFRSGPERDQRELWVIVGFVLISLLAAMYLPQMILDLMK